MGTDISVFLEVRDSQGTWQPAKAEFPDGGGTVCDTCGVEKRDHAAHIRYLFRKYGVKHIFKGSTACSSK